MNRMQLSQILETVSHFLYQLRRVLMILDKLVPLAEAVERAAHIISSLDEVPQLFLDPVRQI